MTLIWFHVTDRLSTGIAVADIDLSRIDSVRARMPISEVTYSWGCKICLDYFQRIQMTQIKPSFLVLKMCILFSFFSTGGSAVAGNPRVFEIIETITSLDAGSFWDSVEYVANIVCMC